MPNLYVRTTPLPDVCGRIDYISNPERQEHLLAVHDSAAALLDGRFWQALAIESQHAYAVNGPKSRLVKNPKTGELEEQTMRCREGREFQIALSNSLLDRMPAKEIAETIALEYKKKLGLDVVVAVHYNAKENNLHAHVILPERQLLEEPVIKIAERNLFFDAEGKRRYKKSDILDENKQLMPGCRIVKKGEIYEQRYFSTVDPATKHKSWLANIKTNVILPLRNGKLRGDIEITEYDPSTGKLAQQHIGVVERIDDPAAKAKAARIRKYNQLVKEYNQLIDDGRISQDEAIAVQFDVNSSAEKTVALEAHLAAFRKREQERKDAAAQQQEAKKWYYRPGWMEDVNKPYRVRRYTPVGRERSIVELVLMLAYAVIQKESRKKEQACEFELPKAQIRIKRDWKIQAIVDAVNIARKEGVQTIQEVKDRLQQVGASLSRARAEESRLKETVDKMTPIMQAIQDYTDLQVKCEKIYAMPDGLDKNIALAQEQADLGRYNQAKATMYRAGVMAPEALQEFLERYTMLNENLQRASGGHAELKEQYSNLSKLKRSLEKSQIEQYCYDLDWGLEEDTQSNDLIDGPQEAPEQREPEIAATEHTDPGDR